MFQILIYLARCLHKPNDCFVHLFKGGAPRAVAPRRAGAPGIFFLQSFFFCAYCGKRKSVNGILISIVSGTIFKHQDALSHFLGLLNITVRESFFVLFSLFSALCYHKKFKKSQKIFWKLLTLYIYIYIYNGMFDFYF